MHSLPKSKLFFIRILIKAEIAKIMKIVNYETGLRMILFLNLMKIPENPFQFSHFVIFSHLQENQSDKLRPTKIPKTKSFQFFQKTNTELSDVIKEWDSRLISSQWLIEMQKKLSGLSACDALIIQNIQLPISAW